MPESKVVALASDVERDLRAIRQILRQPVEAQIARGGLTGPQQSTMAVLVRSEGLSLRDLCKQLGLAHSTVSGIVDRLETQGLVKRLVNDTDRRYTKIVVSDKVREFLQKTWPSLEMHPLEEALRAATPAERQQVLKGVRILRRLLERGQRKESAGKTE